MFAFTQFMHSRIATEGVASGECIFSYSAFPGSLHDEIGPYLLSYRVAQLLLASSVALAQGSLQDYERAEQFLPGNLRHLVQVADVSPRWIEKSNRFWYRRAGLKDTRFIVVDAERNTSVPAFDHERACSELTRADKREYSPGSGLAFF